jgi:Gly-Xaa carboxypeptidase
MQNFHTVDERIHTTAHLTSTRWFYKLIQNTQGWKAD